MERIYEQLITIYGTIKFKANTADEAEETLQQTLNLIKDGEFDKIDNVEILVGDYERFGCLDVLSK